MAHVVPCFEHPSVAGVGTDDAVDNLRVVVTELCLADLEVVSRRLEKLEKEARVGKAGAKGETELLRRLESRLDAGEPARRESLDAEQRKQLRALNLRTLKPEMVVANVDEDSLGEDAAAVERVREAVCDRDPDALVVPVCAQLEAEISDLDPEERQDYLETLGLRERGLGRLVRAGYRMLGLHSFFTMNHNEAQAWTLRVTAPEAAGRVHSDFQDHFIRADTIHWDELVEVGSMKAARSAGKVRSEGRDYVVRDGDVLLFRTSA